MVRLLPQAQAPARPGGLPYREIDIERDADAARFVENVNGGNQTVPVIEFPDGRTATNPSLAEVKAGLAA